LKLLESSLCLFKICYVKTNEILCETKIIIIIIFGVFKLYSINHVLKVFSKFVFEINSLVIILFVLITLEIGLLEYYYFVSQFCITNFNV